MSAETKAAMESAFEAHFADELSDGVLTGYVYMLSGVTRDQIEDGGSAYIWDTPTTQPLHATMGLVRYLKMRSDDYLMGSDVDDD